MITAIIPAHNEADALPRTVASLRAQEVQPDRIIVVSDNSTDNTLEVARGLGVEAIATEGNTHRKAGALNYALGLLHGDQDYVLVMDADTELSPVFITRALSELADPAVGGVGAVFGGVAPTNYIELCTFLEWARYEEQIDRTKKTFVLSGTAALIRWDALETVRERFGQWYNTDTITEDNFLTLALKTCGWELRSPIECRATTEMMPTAKLLYLQRRRWYLGAMQNVTDMGFNRVTRPYWRQQLMLAVSVALLWSLIALTIVSLIVVGPTTPNLLWMCVGAIFAVERVVTIWDQPAQYRLFAAAVILELVYALILQAAYLGALWQKLTGSAGTWNHVETPQAKENNHVWVG